ncbi:MFS transporter [Microcella sp.]|uniref:MFS transporter n=1 Tax=Microcella sp. TaxID=1913979 RepID=UPI00299F5D10|nr:MFS transporter [Microcella sp.]MDX2026708.1 MFS transporter [Microcella sp.]
MSTTPRELPRALRPFATGQYRLLATALVLSLLGTGVWIVAVVWQVIELGGTPVDLSIVATGGSIGLVLAVLLGGVAADRIPQKRILTTVETVKALSMAAMAVLALTGTIEVWHMAVVSLLLGVADGFFYPAYSAWLPALLPADDLLAANGIEGVLRPSLMQAAGPALASAAIAILSPGLGFAIVAVTQGLGAIVLALMRTTAVRREADAEPSHPLVAVWVDVRDGVRYMFRTRWLLATLLYSALLVLAIMGPIEVLLPFAVRDQTGGGAGAFALALAAFGVGGALGSLAVASMRLPRRYLTLMIAAWGVGCAPLAIIGLTDQLWLMIVALFTCGVLFSGATVIWGTLLQRRVPPEMLGRVSSLDFFVSLALMPISMAIAGPVGEIIGIPVAFLAAGLIPVVLATLTLLIARLGPDELAHPLTDTDVVASTDTGPIVTGPGAASGRQLPVDEEHPDSRP